MSFHPIQSLYNLGVRNAQVLDSVIRRSVGCQQTLPRIGYIGWIGQGNLGDDAMYDTAREMMPKAELVPYVHPRRERHLARLGLSGRRYFSSVVLGGGTVITPRLYPHLVREALAQGLPVWSLGSGVGSSGYEMEAEVDINEWKYLLQQFIAVGVRGPRSKAALEAMGVKGVEVVGDLALRLALPHTLEQTSPPSFAVNLALPPDGGVGPGERRVLAEFEAAARHLIASGWAAVPIAMHVRDVAPTQALMGRIGHAGAVHLPQTATELLTLVGRCSLSVAVRLHVAVLSCCAGVPPLMLGYRDKCLDFMESMGLEEWHEDLYHPTPVGLSGRILALSEGAVSRESVLRQAQMWQGRLESYVQRLAPTVGLHREAPSA